MSAEHDEKNAGVLKFFDVAQQVLLDKLAKAVQDIDVDIESYGSTHAPVRYGFLRASIQAQPVQLLSVGGRIIIRGSVAAAVPYAYIQHENVYYHPKGGEDHYLSRPMEERANVYQKSLADAMASALAAAKSAL